MAKITYVEHDGREHTVEVAPGLSIMEGATKNSIPGIDADCGGACACATCMIYVPDEWRNKLPPVSEMEQTMLEFSENADESSRLACQIPVSAEMDGLRIDLPKAQF